MLYSSTVFPRPSCKVSGRGQGATVVQGMVRTTKSCRGFVEKLRPGWHQAVYSFVYCQTQSKNIGDIENSVNKARIF